jgi:Flp pilus assembly pilin Flp
MSFLPCVHRFLSEERGAVAINMAILIAIVAIVGLVANASIVVSAAP